MAEFDKDVKDCIRKWSLKNAFDYKLAIPAKVISRVVGEHPALKADMKGLMMEINEVCKEVNSHNYEWVSTEIQAYAFEEKSKEEGEKKLELPGAQMRQVVTRFPPEPSGYPHIGHAKAAFLNFESAKQYGGGMRLRMDDTNPEKESAEFVEGIIESLKWLGISWIGEITYTSDYMEKLYEYADELMLKQKAYVCTCPADEVKKGRERGEQCMCRTRFPEENVIEFRKMMTGKVDEGAAILRFKGNMKAENTTMRDPTLFRVLKTKHYRQEEKYFCWPSYDFAAPIIDSIEGVTHAMRSKEYEMRDELYFSILKILELRAPRLIHFSRLAIAGAPVSKRLITPLIQEGKVLGYDDPRLPTIVALRRRGIKPEAIRSFVLSFGLSKVESEPGWEKLLNENKKLIDPTSVRKFFVKDPVRLEISGLPPRILQLKNHPQNPDMGVRKIEAHNVVYIPRADADFLFEETAFRLKDWCNVKMISSEEAEYAQPDGSMRTQKCIKAEYVADEGEVARKMQWVSDAEKIACEVLEPRDLLIAEKYNPESLITHSGWAEKSAGDLELRTTIQFERFGFVTLDEKMDGKMLRFIMVSQ